MQSVLGIDVAKAKFDVHLLSDGKARHRVFDNDDAGFEALANWLVTIEAGSLHACMEATGGYGDDLALFLHENGHRVSIVNPARIKAFGQSEGVRTKTDKVDAGVIARFCRAQQPRPWTPPSPRMRELRALVRRCGALKEMRAKEHQRRSHGSASALVRASIETSIRRLDDEITAIGDAVAALIAGDDHLRQSNRLLMSIPGIGAQSAAILLAEITDFRAFSHNKKISAFAGLSPQEHTSGSSVRGKTRVSKSGNARLRAVLYMCALSARRYNPTLNAFADRLKEAGKSPKVVLVAVARKLLVIAYGVMKSGETYQVDHRA